MFKERSVQRRREGTYRGAMETRPSWFCGSGLIVMGYGRNYRRHEATLASPTTHPHAKMVPSGPACGDGLINQDSENATTGKWVPGDGCFRDLQD